MKLVKGQLTSDHNRKLFLSRRNLGGVGNVRQRGKDKSRIHFLKLQASLSLKNYRPVLFLNESSYIEV